jgi:acyl carrier protein
MDIQADIVAFLASKSRIPVNQLDGATGVYGSGYFSSLAILELMSHLEGRFGIQIAPEELVEDNFKDIATLVGFIRAKRQA